MQKKSFKAFFHRLIPGRLLLPWIFFWKGGRAKLASEYGWARSLRHLTPLDQDDRPIPWIPYSAIAFLSGRLGAGLAVLELGSGYSTLWFMRRVARVVALEHNEKWLEWMRGQIGPNVDLVATRSGTAEEYLAPLRGTPERFDLILIDGIHRIDSFQEAVRLLTPAGVVVLDDSHRPSYGPVFAAAVEAGMRRLDFEGHKAASVNLYRTTVFYRDGNCLGI